MAEDFAFFDARTAEIFRAVAGTVVPGTAERHGADADRCIAVADAAVAGRPEADRKLLATFLKVVDLLGLLRFGRPFRKLPVDKRARVLAWLATNRRIGKFRAGAFGLKTYALMGYYGHPDTFAELGYPGPRLDAPFYQAQQDATEAAAP